MNSIDLIIFFSCIAVSAGIGAIASARFRKNSDFHLGGAHMGWFPVAASLTATVFSAINFTGFTTEIVRHGLYTVMAIPMLLLAVLPVAAFFIPLFVTHRCASIYGFLEQRYNTSVRRLTSALFILWRIAWMTVVLHAASVFLSGITSISPLLITLLCACVVTSYTAMGGMRSVMMTDIFQCIILLIALVAIAACVLPSLNAGMISAGAQGGAFRPFFPFDPEIFSPSPTVRISFWSCLIGATTAFIARYGADQMVGQRYLAARDSREAVRGFLFNIVMYLVVLSCLIVIGLAMRLTAENAGNVSDGLIIRNFLSSMPRGIAGLLAGGLFLATMSSLDSGLHSCATSLSMDILRINNAAGRSLWKDRLIVIAIGFLVTFGAIHVHRLGSVFEIANKIINGLGSPLLAIVLLGMTRNSTTSRGMLAGIVLGTAASAWSSASNTALSLHHHATVNLLITILACCFCSAFCNHRARAQASAGKA